MGWIYNAPESTPTHGSIHITGVAIAMTGLSFIFCLLRAYVRGRLIHAWGLDDWIIFFTWSLACAFTVVTSFQTRWGLGLEDTKLIPEENRYMFGVLQYTGWPLYILSIFGFKLSLLVSYFRFVPQGMCKYGVSIVLTACVLFHLAYLIVQLNLCDPVSKYWNPDTPGHCIQRVPFYISTATLTIVFDFNVMFLPFPVLIKSQIQTRKKVVLLGLFALGFFVTVIQIVRIAHIRDLRDALRSSTIVLWSAVEVHLGVVCACVPVLSPLLKVFREKKKRSGNKSRRTRLVMMKDNNNNNSAASSSSSTEERTYAYAFAPRAGGSGGGGGTTGPDAARRSWMKEKQMIQQQQQQQKKKKGERRERLSSHDDDDDLEEWMEYDDDLAITPVARSHSQETILNRPAVLLKEPEAVVTTSDRPSSRERRSREEEEEEIWGMWPGGGR
ncbi:integral membrane protein [Xylariomycetidae sp. FL2044]|nr:integral membrane protein [Xylariomycetidae sp. FL2044]